MARLPCTISLMRRGGTPMSFASRYSVRPSGLRNSSTSISPGVASAGTSRFRTDRADFRADERCTGSALRRAGAFDDRREVRGKIGGFVGRHIPDDQVIHTAVIVDETVTHPSHLAPFESGKLR